MEPTRVGSFDDEMHNQYKIKCSDDSSITVSDVDIYNAIINGTLPMSHTGKMYWESQVEDIEQSIADSHDITKSNFGFNSKLL